MTYDGLNTIVGACPERSRRDAENHLTSAGGLAYLYDGDGKRVGKAPSNTPTQPNYLYWYGAGPQILEETDGAGNYLYDDFYFNGMLLARGEPDNWVDHFFADALGNARCVYGDGDPDGGCSDYYPFGGERPIPSCCPTNPGGVNVPFMFTGKERDSESGLDNFTARYFGSSLGRFMSPDPLAGHTEDPQTLNRYVYVRNNPLNLTDPTGLDFYLSCTQSKDNASTCQQVQIGDKKFWVQGSTGDNGKFDPTVVTSASLQDPHSGNSATVNESGVQITTASGTSQGVFAPGTAAANNIQGSGLLQGFSFNINGNCEGAGACMASGTFKFNGTEEQARKLLEQRGSFTMIGDIFGVTHPGSTQHRFRDPNNPTGPSSHLSLFDTRFPMDAGGLLWMSDPRATVPTTGDFHVDPHGTTWSHLVCDLLNGCN
jgi:RHS repeat-associated protein